MEFSGLVQSFETLLEAICINILTHHCHHCNFNHCHPTAGLAHQICQNHNCLSKGRTVSPQYHVGKYHLLSMSNHQEAIHFLRSHLNPTSSSRRISTSLLRNWFVKYAKSIQTYKVVTRTYQ